MLKSVDLSGFLNDLLKDDAILVVNKSDLIKGKLDPKISKARSCFRFH